MVDNRRLFIKKRNAVAVEGMADLPLLVRLVRGIEFIQAVFQVFSILFVRHLGFTSVVVV